MGESNSMMGENNSMMDMINSMGKHQGHGDKEANPMDMCKEMMSKITQSNDLATFATPEVRQLFEEWVQQVDEEILNMLLKDDTIEPDKIAEELKISKNSVLYFISRLAQNGKISIKVGKVLV
jgi:hypothetical protein